MAEPIEVRKLGKSYVMAGERLPVLRDIDADFRRGELNLVVGPSGSGKTTFVSILAGLDADFTGEVRIAGRSIARLSRADRVALRTSAIGLVFQNYLLLSQLSALENVEAPLFLRDMAAGERRQRASEAMELVQLSNRHRHRPAQLSGGERQRTAIARAIVGGADILLCDEPTGNLNREISRSIFGLLRDLCHDHGKTVVLTTHDPTAEAFADRVLAIKDEQLVEAAPPC